MGKDLTEAGPEDLKAFIEWIEGDTGPRSAKPYLWALRYYYDYASNEPMAKLAARLRDERMDRSSFRLKNLVGIDPKVIARLEASGIGNVEQMLEAGGAPRERRELSEVTGVPLGVVLEVVRLSGLARIPGIKGVRTRLYHDAGIDTIEKLAHSDPQELRKRLVEFVQQTGFNGIAPLPKEVEFSVRKARELPRRVDYSD